MPLIMPYGTYCIMDAVGAIIYLGLKLKICIPGSFTINKRVDFRRSYSDVFRKSRIPIYLVIFKRLREY